MAKICLVTPAQPSTNPRLVKEADALSEAGHEVHVIYAHVSSWADESDKVLLARRAWSYRRIGGRPGVKSFSFWWTQRRHRLAYRLAGHGFRHCFLDGWICDRVAPELKRAAESYVADVYIGHNTAALPAVVSAARKNRARCGFDIEDYFSGMDLYGAKPSHGTQVTTRIEASGLPQCDYLTAVSPEVAEVYQRTYGVAMPSVVLNVFPLIFRPAEWRSSRNEDPLTLYWVSQNIGDEKLDSVVRAMGQLRDLNIELHLRGTWHLGYRDKVMSLAASCGVRPERIISHPVQPADEMIRLAAAYDVGLVLEHNVSPFHDLCLTNKIFTYILAGNAVITTATKAHQNIAAKIGNAAFCYKSEDVQALTARLRLWYMDREALRAARRRAWDEGRSRYNWELEKNAFLGAIGPVLAG